MPENQVNPERVYYNYQGELPPLKLVPHPARIPRHGRRTDPKKITDTTLRDGAQDPGFAIFPNEAKLKYFDLLHELDNGTGVIESVEVFIYQKRDLWTLDKLLERGYQYPQVTTWTRATPKDIKELVRVSEGRIKETGILASASDHHIFDRLGFKSKAEAVERYLVPILTACEYAIRPRVHLEDATRADVNGWMIPFIRRVLEETKNTACFRICDTLGLGTPEPHAALPFGIPRLVSTLEQATSAEFEFHGHNDLGYVIGNSMAALRYGCKRVNVTFGGLGERTGNAPLEMVLANYVREYGDPGFQRDKLAEIAELIHTRVSPISEKQPIVGGGIFKTQAGLHQTGVEKQKEAPGGLIYMPFDPSAVGRVEDERHRIGSLTGIDGIISVLNYWWATNGQPRPPLTSTSRLAKLVYDAVHAAFDGEYDPGTDRFINYRTTLFEAAELAQLAHEIEAARGESS